ncbi:hypothetical protein LTR66_011842 [Elasticomyces elasticus]|nr:hypothetical protein LTR66_011842 [Elasticomyces elasticus]KAK4987926.1 hypothetical protein LTR50_004263 [Elasticomyces elasticus]
MPVDPAITLPPTKDRESGDNSSGGDIVISDVLGSQRTINIFAGFTRDISSVSSRLDSSSENTTLLAPINSAITSLPRKPWEDPKEYEKLGEQAYEGQAGEDRAHMNLRRFVEAHVIPVSPWKEGEKVESVGGGKLWWEKKNGKKIVQPGNIEVESVSNKVANGEIWILKDVLNYV